MNNKITIKGAKLVETQREVTLPAFFKHKTTAQYAAFFTTNRALTMSNYDFCRDIKESNHIPDIEDSMYVEITSEEFFSAYNDCKKHIEDSFGAIAQNSHADYSTGS